MIFSSLNLTLNDDIVERLYKSRRRAVGNASGQKEKRVKGRGEREPLPSAARRLQVPHKHASAHRNGILRESNDVGPLEARERT